MKCVRGRLFTVDGLIEDEGQIGNLILEEISGVLTSGLSKVVTNLLASIKLQAYSPPLPIETDRLHVANRAAATGGHSHLAGVFGLLPAANHQGTEDAHAHRQGRRG